MKRPIVMFAVFAAICLVLLPFWALQTKGGADASPEASVSAEDQQGLELFQINCASCHTLAAAGTDGQVGPNLDQLLGTGEKSPTTVKSNRDRVLNAVENGLGGIMPPGLVKGSQANAVAGFVADNVAYVGGSTAPSTATSPSP
jgi:mono/diheme cytochrome c family protein